MEEIENLFILPNCQNAGHAVAKGLKDTIEEIQKDMGKRMYETCLRGHLPDSDSLLTKNDIVRLKRCIFAQGAANLPPITTHNVVGSMNVLKNKTTFQTLSAVTMLLFKSWGLMRYR